MVSKNNFRNKQQQAADRTPHYGLRKLSIGVASVLLSTSLYMGVSATAKADSTVQAENAQTELSNDNSKNANFISADTPTTTKNDESKVETSITGNQAITKAINDAIVTTDQNDQNQSATNQPAQPAVRVNDQENEQQVKESTNVTINYVNDYDPRGVLNWNRRQGHWEYKPASVRDYRPGDTNNDILLRPIPGYKLLNEDALTQYFDFDAQGKGTFKGAPEDTLTITLHYAPLADILVQYVDEDTGQVLASAKLPSWAVMMEDYWHRRGDEKAPDASRYIVSALNIPGYQLTSAPSIEGRYTNDFPIKERGKNNYKLLTFTYKNVSGNEAPAVKPNGDTWGGAPTIDQDPNIDWSSMPGGFTISGIYGSKVSADNGDVEKKKADLIERYRKQGFSYVGTTADQKNDDYYNFLSLSTDIFLVPNKPVTVHYVDENGNKLADDVILSSNSNNPDQTNNGVNTSNYWNPAGEWHSEEKQINNYHRVKIQGATSGEFVPFDYEVTYVYAKDQGNVIIKVHDNTNGQDLPSYGFTGGEQNVDTDFSYDLPGLVSRLENAGYKVLNPNATIPNKIVKGTQTVTINVEHTYTTVTPDQPGHPGDPVDPSNPDGPKYPEGTTLQDVKRTGTQTVHYQGAGNLTPEDNVQSTDFTRTITFDNVTGEITHTTDWNEASHTFTDVNTPKVDGYHADRKVVEGQTVTPDDLNKTVVVTYIPNAIPVTPEKPDVPESETPVTPNTSGNQETPATPTTPEIDTPAQPVEKQASKKADQLPQTGNNDQALVAGLGLSALAALLGLSEFGKKKHHN